MNSERRKFGVILLPYAVSFQGILDAAKHAEDLGFDSVWISDHLQRGSIPTLECWSTIAALSAQTKKVRIGSLVTCNSYRNPVLLAKIIATTYQISNGRIELGIGAGYDPAEHVAAGIAFSSLKERIERLEESLKILKALWADGKTSQTGKYWNIQDAICEPKPTTPPRIWIAGRNEKIFELASRYADGVNILPYSGTMDRRRISSIGELGEVVRKIDSYRKMPKSLYCGDGGMIIGKDENDYLDRVRAEAANLKLSEAQMIERLRNLSIAYGTVSDCRRALDSLSEFEELMLIFPGWQRGNYYNMDLFAREFL